MYMKRVDIIASGDVQKVGFRDVVQKIGRDLGLSGTVENREPYDVRIVAEGEEDGLKEFIEALKIKRGPIHVRELEVSWSEATGEFPYFKILRGDWQEELGERFDVAVGLLYRSIEIGEENLALGRENLALGKENLAVSKENLAIGKKMLEKQDTMIERQDETIGEIRGMRSDFQDHMEKRFTKIEGEIAEIKAAIADIKGNA
ncbi:MAG: acylphosphatase [Methanothrix sp.]|uniref:acylphosphatase n=1 Tax=Methanothrix harundinacea TaxID=301375 RepID=A0A101IK41_9EURY|nr:MAG: Acylphosphatases-like protein [Methanothrix harundinacea]KUK96728.1 MAG: Acylphosphatases-like protein [Methanothrix harundinacea]MDD5769164.1 acylphosphatase [Methanothrix sp.]